MRRLVRDWTYSPSSPETLLVAFCLKNQKLIELLNKYPYVVDFEYEINPGYTNLGKGDLILADAKNNLLAAEFKYIDLISSGKTARTKRNKDRGKVQEQALIYANMLQRKYPKAEVNFCSITNEEISWELRMKFKEFVEKKQTDWVNREANLFPI